MSTIALPAVPGTADDTEPFQTLLSSSRKKTGSIPEEVLVRHVLTVTAEADWPVQRAAMEALLRRVAFAESDGLRVAARPSDGSVFGFYGTRRAGSDARPYSTLLLGVSPPRGSCECPDFLRGSLGLCKHLLVTLDDVWASSRRRAQALRSQPPPELEPAMMWDPVRPLSGPGDALERVRVAPDRLSQDALHAARPLFRSDGDGLLVPRSVFAGAPERRLALVEDLLRLLEMGRRRRGGYVVEPAVRPLLQAERARLSCVDATAASAARVRQAVSELKQRLYPYQIEGVSRILGSGRLLLADDMGLGKTVQAIAACHALFAKGKIRRGLLIVPAALKPQWLREWQLFSEAPVAVVDGPPAERQRAYARTTRGFLIANYEQVLRDLEWMHRFRPDIVVLDEAQRIKNWATKTAAFVKRLQPPYRLVLTGTPMENRLDELASVLGWVDDLALEPKWRLSPWHSTYADGRAGVIGARNLDTLRARMAPSVLRRVRSEVLKQLPPRTDTLVPIAITPAQLEEHAALDQPIAQILARAKKRPLTQAEFLRLMVLLTTQRIISNGLAQLRFQEVWPEIEGRRPEERILATLDSPKLAELREIVAQVAIAQGRKIVVFSQWRRMLKLAHWAVSDVLGEAGLRATFFTGHEGQRRRTQNIVEFHDDPAVRILFASDAGGVGLNLQRAASCCINIELPWNPAVLEQRVGRIYRLGQKAPIDVYNLVTQTCIEARIAGIVSAKKALFSGLFDGGSNEVQFERSGAFLERLQHLITPVAAPELPPVVDEPVEAQAAVEQALDDVVAEADESGDAVPAAETVGAAAASPAQWPALQPDAVRRLFSQLTIQPREDGGVHIDAPPEAAAGLAALFEGMAALLRKSSTPT